MATESIHPNAFSSASMEQLIADHFSEPPTAPTVTAPQPSETTHSPSDSIPSSLGVQEMPPGENTVSPTPPAEQEAIPDPRIVPLLAIFPTFDHAILADVLDSCNGSEEKAVDILLGMTDPDHIPQTNVQDISQTERDELLAHRLMIEEQESNSSRSHTQPNNLPYVPRTRMPRKSRGYPVPSDPTVQDSFKDSTMSSWKQNAKSGPNLSGGGGGSDFQDQFNKIADTGRKTFNNIFSKVKAKISDSSSSSQQPQASQYDVAGPEPTYERSGEGNGYDVTPKIPQSSSPPAAANVDRSKLGLLPKRPVSLGTSPPPSEVAHARNVDDDLYVDNPFEHHQ